MVVIGDRLNPSVGEVARAIRARDAKPIQRLAEKQAALGADYLDISAELPAGREEGDLGWLAQTVEQAVELPLCLDSRDAALLARLMPQVRRPGILNSVSGERARMETLLPLAVGTSWRVVVLACDETGIPQSAEQKFDILSRVIERGVSLGLAPGQILADPLVSALSTDGETLSTFCRTVAYVRETYPGVGVLAGVSNISYGMPARRAVDGAFLTLAMSAGADYALMDISSPEVCSALYAADALLGRDKHCRRFLNGYRRGLFGPEDGPEQGA